MYVPRGERCGAITTFDAHLHSLNLRATLPEEKPNRTSVLLIQRSDPLRRFLLHDSVLGHITKKVAKYGMQVEVFSDDPLPSLRDTLQMFNRALIIVAPHGAGMNLKKVYILV